MKRILFVFSIVLAFASCNKASMSEDSGKYGILNMNVDVATTKAALSTEELLNSASVKIYKANHKGLVREYRYSEMPSPLYLATDVYRVDVEAGEAVKEAPELASWEQKTSSEEQDSILYFYPLYCLEEFRHMLLLLSHFSCVRLCVTP